MAESCEAKRYLRSLRNESRPSTIVITGCSSGIGLQASKLLRETNPNSRLYLVARNEEKADYAAKHVQGVTNRGSHRNIIPMVCDHSSLDNVRSFCADLRRRVGVCEDVRGRRKTGIDVLCLNAAVLLGEDSDAVYTVDDIELTFQTNHLSSFLIVNLVYDLLNPGGRVVITTSGLQAFAKFNNFEGMFDHDTLRTRKRFEMIDGSKFDHKQSYSTSKLCNVSFCLELNRRLKKRNVIAVCFTPGLIPSSGLFRHQKRWNETALKKQAVGIDETEEWGGAFLAWMAFSDEAAEEGATYWRAPLGISKRGGKIPDDLVCASVNDEAKDLSNCETLWKRSADLAGIPVDLIPIPVPT